MNTETTEQIPLFADVMALVPVGEPGHYSANLNAHWTIGPKPHGGVMIALCANAARQVYGDGAHPIAVSANYLSAPDPGPVRLITTIRKRGRRIGLVDVELVQGDATGERICVHAVVTLGEPEHEAAPLFCDNPVTALMDLEPPADVLAIGPGHPAAEINNLARGCDIRPLVVDSVADGAAPRFQVWARPRVGAVDELFALMCGDISLPVPYAVGRRGWAPTVQLTAYLRGIPADGWLRVLCTTTQIGADWFDEDHTVVDSAGRIVVQTRQLALVPGL
ncbi:MAG: thioesterase family protein [Mycobacterium sp.]|nr:thioesterase family protein [Mycobacterium sp.]